MGQALDIVNKFFNEQDVSVLADDFKFIGPVDQTNGKDAFLELSAGFIPLIAEQRMLTQFENDNSVCLIYEMDLNMPSGETMTLKIADWVKVENGKMVEERIYYDAREFAAAVGK